VALGWILGVRPRVREDDSREGSGERVGWHRAAAVAPRRGQRDGGSETCMHASAHASESKLASEFRVVGRRDENTSMLHDLPCPMAVKCLVFRGRIILSMFGRELGVVGGRIA
jgi:hypothetical protein